MRVWAAPGAISQTTWALHVASTVLSNYSDWFGIAYPLAKLDLIALPDFGPGKFPVYVRLCLYLFVCVRVC